MKTSEFYYDLPESLIAQTPAEPRDAARLLAFDRASETVSHRRFFDIIDYLKTGDVLVVNNTRVLPVRLFGVKGETGGRAEFLLLKRLNLTDWEAAVKPAKRAKIGTEYAFSDELTGHIIGEKEEGIRVISFTFTGVFEDILRRIGEMPLPHYIKEMPDDTSRYNTVYAKTDGSAAAPTAGLHFTPELLKKVKDKGITVVEVLLHIGLGTFRPVKAETVEEHKMHSEHYEVSEAAAGIINAAKRDGRRVIAVGTTSVRVLESAAKDGELKAGAGDTDIFIYPPYKFRLVDALITNFHLPGSTLLMLVSAFMGKSNAIKTYETAVNEGYRFFSFGDAMFIQ